MKSEGLRSRRRRWYLQCEAGWDKCLEGIEDPTGNQRMRLLISYWGDQRSFHERACEPEINVCVGFWKDEVKELILGKHNVTCSGWR